MKPATQILIAIVGALSAGFVSALVSRAKELMAVFVKASFGYIIAILAAMAFVENFGWDPIKHAALVVVYWIAMLFGGLLALVLFAAAVAQLWRYLQAKFAAGQEAAVVVETDQDPS